MIKHLTTGIFMLLLFLLTALGQQEERDKEEHNINFIIIEIARGWEKGDTVVFRKYYSQDSTTRMIESGDEYRGMEDFIRHHVLFERAYFEERSTKINAVEVHLADDLKSAWSISDFEFRATTIDGEHIHSKGYETIIWAKKNGEWKVIHSHYSAGQKHIRK